MAVGGERHESEATKAIYIMWHYQQAKSPFQSAKAMLKLAQILLSTSFAGSFPTSILNTATESSSFEKCLTQTLTLFHLPPLLPLPDHTPLPSGII